MSAAIDQLVRRLLRLLDAGSPARFRDLLDESSGAIGAWSGWLLMCLLQTHLRLVSFAERLQVKIPAQGKSLSETTTSFGHKGYFPDEPNIWFEVNDCGIEIKDRSTGHEYFFCPHAPTQISLMSLESTLRRMTVTTFPEERLRDLHRTPSTLYVSAAELLASDLGVLLKTWPGDDSVELTEVADPLLCLWPSIERRLSDEGFRRRLAAVAGDWEYLLQDKAFPEYASTFEQGVESRRNQRRQFALRLANDDKWLGPAMNGLADIDAPELPEIVERALGVTPVCFHGTVRPQFSALRLVAERKLETLYPRVFELMQATRPRSQFAVYGPWLASIEVLLEVKYRVDDALEELGDARAGWRSAAELSLHHAPHLSRDLFRRALTHSTHGGQEMTAGVLAILGEPWTEELLLDLLEETDDIRLMLLCHATLSESSNHVVRSQAEDLWRKRCDRALNSSLFKQPNMQLFRHTISHRSEEIFALRGRVK
jgi:hypothetical protein